MICVQQGRRSAETTCITITIAAAATTTTTIVVIIIYGVISIITCGTILTA